MDARALFMFLTQATAAESGSRALAHLVGAVGTDEVLCPGVVPLLACCLQDDVSAFEGILEALQEAYPGKGHYDYELRNLVLLKLRCPEGLAYSRWATLQHLGAKTVSDLLGVNAAAFEALVLRVGPFASLPRRLSAHYLDADGEVESRVRRSLADLQALHQPEDGGRPCSQDVADRVLHALCWLKNRNTVTASVVEPARWSKSSFARDIEHVLWAMFQALGDTVRFPTPAEQVALAAQIPQELAAHFSGLSIFGVVDGCHQAFPKPATHYPRVHGRYFSGKYDVKDFVYNNQFVFDLTGQLIDYGLGGFGSDHDSNRFRFVTL